MSRVQAFLVNLWNLRHSSQRRVRCAWWAGVVCLVLLVIAPRAVVPLLWVGWLVVNVLLTLTAVGWGLVHPLAVLRARGVATRWAFWLAFLTTLFYFSFVRTFLAETVGIAFSPALLFLIAFSSFCILFSFLLAMGFVGASIGVFVGRGQKDADSAAHIGTGAWWLTTLLVLLVAGLLLGRESRAAALVSGIPLLTVWIATLTQRPAYDPQEMARRLMNWLGQRLVWRWARKTRTRTFDARGVTLGSVAAVLALLVGATNLFLPVQTWVLASLIQLRNEPLSSQVPESLSMFREEASLAQRERVVLLDMDTLTRRKILTDDRSSEAAIQADVIRRLSAWGAQRVVLPLPSLDADWLTDTATTPDVPQLDEIHLRRSVRDLPQLINAMRRSGNVLLAVPQLPFISEVFSKTFSNSRQLSFLPDDAVRAAVDRLAKAARETGGADLESYASVQLPVISTVPVKPLLTKDSRRVLPVPIMLFAAVERREASVRSVAGRSDLVEIAGKRMPLIAPNKILVDFFSAEPGRAFSRVSYASVLSGASLYVKPLQRDPMEEKKPGKWLSPQEYFRDKIVFLDSLERRPRQTPIGAMSQAETLANATATLLSGVYVRRSSPVLWVLFLGAMVGYLCNRRAPLAAGWRASVMVFVAIVVTVGAFFGGDWLDAVVPIAGIVGSFLLVTQFTYALRERDRGLLQRFVAPQLIEEYIDRPEDLGLGGTRRKICVLFADVRNFTPFAERHTPEQVIEVINAYMTAMTDALHAHGGFVDKYTGDGLMALFYVTDAPREDVERAVRAALDMRDAAERISAHLLERGQEPLHVGIGIHYGEAVVGVVGNPVRQINLTALGETVVVSARLQSIAAGGEVVVSDAVYSAVSGAFHVEEGEPVQVKGISEPVRPYRVTARQDV